MYCILLLVHFPVVFVFALGYSSDTENRRINKAQDKIVRLKIINFPVW